MRMIEVSDCAVNHNVELAGDLMTQTRNWGKRDRGTVNLFQPFRAYCITTGSLSTGTTTRYVHQQDYPPARAAESRRNQLGHDMQMSLVATGRDLSHQRESGSPPVADAADVDAHARSVSARADHIPRRDSTHMD